jgi:hypothetical protein
LCSGVTQLEVSSQIVPVNVRKGVQLPLSPFATDSRLLNK